MTYGEPDFSVLTGKTLLSVVGGAGDDQMTLTCTDGSEYRLYHSQDCCESVNVEDIIGDVSDILGSPILVAQEVANDLPPKTHEGAYSYTDDSATWTFYKIDTAKGGVTIRWYGSSNGYYSESVDFACVTPAKPGAEPK